MKKILLLSLFSCFILAAFSQPYNPEKIKKKAVQYYNQAQQRAIEDNYVSAIGLLLQAVDADNNYVDAHMALGSLYASLKSHKNSIKYFEKAFSLDSNYSFDYKSPYSIQLAALGEFEKALAAINELLSKKPPKNPTTLDKLEARRKSYQFAIDFEKNNPDKSYVFAPQNVGPGINTSEPEYFPSLNIDANELVFTRRIRNINEDFYSSKLNGDKWEESKPLEGNINTPQSEAAQTISQDGQLLIFTARDRRDSYGNYDLYYSRMTAQGWSESVNLGGNVNSDQWDSQPCLSPDKRDLYFASRRLGGFGGSDIYVCSFITQWKME